MLYHVSPTPGLKTLQPRISSHKKPYVYAIDSLVTALLFGARKDDFDFLLDMDDQGRPVIYECYPNAFPEIYRGKHCSVYELEDTGFLRGMTGWEPELVCETEVSVLREIAVNDLYSRLLDEEATGKLVIHRYCQYPEYRRLIAGHLIDRLIRFDLLAHFDTTDPRGDQHFRPLLDGLKALLDGHLLPATASAKAVPTKISTEESDHGNQL